MTMKTRIRTLLANGASGRECVVAGWVRSVRASKEVAFVTLNDGSDMAGLQVVVGKDLANFDSACRIGTGAALRVHGTLEESPAAGQQWELHATIVEIIGDADDAYPLQKKRHTFEYLRTIAHLRPRTNTLGAVFRL
ncbi:MAG: OB-fold nucleic acid binding domain-containing protein, partial [Oryzomonas sp.]